MVQARGVDHCRRLRRCGSRYRAGRGWKTISDAKATADEAARAAAKAKIAEVLQEQSVKKLVEETAAELFKNGAYRQLIQQQTQSQLGKYGPTRLLDANAATAGVPKFQQFKGKKVEVDSCVFDEPVAFATSLVAVLRQAGLDVKFSKDGQACQNTLGETVILVRDEALFSALDGLIYQASDVHARKGLGPPNPPVAAMVVIARRTQ